MENKYSLDDIKMAMLYIMNECSNKVLPPFRNPINIIFQYKLDVESYINLLDDTGFENILKHIKQKTTRTKHKYLVCKRSKPGSNIFLYIKDVYIYYEQTDITKKDSNEWNDKLTKIDKFNYGGGCIWNSDTLVMDMESEYIVKQLHSSSLIEYLQCNLGWDIMLCDVSSLADENGEISVEHEFFK